MGEIMNAILFSLNKRTHIERAFKQNNQCVQYKTHTHIVILNE